VPAPGRRRRSARPSARRERDGARHVCASSRMSRATSAEGRSCASVERRKPGWISPVTAHPPASARLELSGVIRLRAVEGGDRPLRPAPTMTMSCPHVTVHHSGRENADRT
jgi:hypothetical protein